MKRPFFIVALFYLAGIELAEWVPLPLPWLFAAALAAAITLLSLLFLRWKQNDNPRWTSAPNVLLWVFLTLAGWTNQTCHTVVLSPNDLRQWIGDRTEEVRLRGTLRASPTERIVERAQGEFWRSTTLLVVDQIQRGSDWQPAFGTVVVATPGLLDSNFFSGQRVEIDGVIRPPSGPIAPGLFDPRSYWKRKEVYYQVQCATNEWTVVRDGIERTRPFSDRFEAWARRTLALGLPAEDQALRLTWTLEIGRAHV